MPGGSFVRGEGGRGLPGRLVYDVTTPHAILDQVVLEIGSGFRGNGRHGNGGTG